MLRFVLGPAGSGKSSALFTEMERAVRAGHRAILLVPEQLSFESEKKLYRTLGPQLALNVEVLSFTRLCNSIFRTFGGLANSTVTPAAKLLLMSVALEELRGSLQIYHKSAANTTFIQTMLETCSEFKAAGARPEYIAQAADQCEGQLADKLRELSVIYGTYQALLERGYTDADDDLIRACALLELENFFVEYDVFVDGFTTFMAAEFELLSHVIGQAPECWFAFTCDELTDRRQGMGVFSPVQSAAARLMRLAKQQMVPIAEPIVLTQQRRFRNAALAHLAGHVFQADQAPYCGPVSGLQIYQATDRYAEMEYVAASIAHLVREQGIRYREIAVVARETDPYRRAVELSFARYGIPYFMDEPFEAANHPLVSALLHATEAVRGNFASEPVLQLAKSPVLGLGMQEVARLDNYCYIWGVRGAAWLTNFTANPRGLADGMTEADAVLLEEINRTRMAVVRPLEELRQALNAGSGRSFAAGLYRFLMEVQASENLIAYADELPQEERAAFLNESAQIWDNLIDVLDIFGDVLGDVQLKRARLCELLRLALNTVEVGMRPQTLDQVLIGKADRIRPVNLRAVFVIGAAEGEFPAQIGQSGLFNDAERRQMVEAGLEVSGVSLKNAVLEQFFAYFSLTLASEHLTVSWPRVDMAGQELLASSIVAQIRTLFPTLVPHDPEEDYLVMGDAPAFDLLARQFGNGGVLKPTLCAYFAEQKSETLARMQRIRLHPEHEVSDRSLARGLFGGRMRLSPSRVERFYRCPFAYYARDGLDLKKRQKAEFTPLESGSAIHHVLQVMVQRHGGRALVVLPEQQLRAEIDGIIRDYISARVEDVSKLTPRFRYLFNRLTGTLARLLRRIGQEFQQSEFVPAACELPISEREGVRPLQLETLDGTPVTVEGVVDRVDIMQKNGKRYVRVIDYKSGIKQFALADILYGINMQMLLYLFTISENGRGELGGCVPAGVLYMPVREAFVSSTRGEADSKIAAEREKQWKMNGLLLEDEEALRGMERDIAGVYIPAKLGKNGFDRYSSLAGKAEMGALAGKVKKLIVKMAEELLSGKVPSLPTKSSDFDTCAYCDYRAVCGMEDGDPVREIAWADRAEILKLLEEGNDG